jgi:hypothetical protein
VAVFENSDVLPRAWLSSNYLEESDPEKIVRTLENERQRTIVVDSLPAGVEKSSYFQDTTSVREGINRVEIEAESDRNTLLFLSQTFYPGWSAFVDGERKSIIRANFAYQAVLFPKGHHTVIFIYEPKSFRIGWWISMFTFIVLSGILLNEAFRKKRRRTSQESSS